MSDDRKFQKRQRRTRRQARRASQPIEPLQYPGIIGWFQRNQRVFFVVGIVVMVLSLGAGAALFGTDHSGSSSDDPSEDSASIDDPDDDATETLTPTDTPTAEPTADDDGIVRTYEAPPEMTIDVSLQYQAVIHTEKGDIRLELLPEEAPGYVNNFVFLARNQFYDGLTFHRVDDGFVAQAGDPTGTSQGGAGYTLGEELNDLPFESGVLSMAKSAEGVSGSQFFLTLRATPELEPQDFTVFGRVIEGNEVLQALTIRDPNVPGQPPGDRILSIEIIEQES